MRSGGQSSRREKQRRFGMLRFRQTIILRRPRTPFVLPSSLTISLRRMYASEWRVAAHFACPLSPFHRFWSLSPPLAEACSGGRSARDATTDPTRIPSGVRFSVCRLAELVFFRSESASDRVGRPLFTFPPPPSLRPPVSWSIGCQNLVSLSALTKTVTCL